jgi:hypothetical protein
MLQGTQIGCLTFQTAGQAGGQATCQAAHTHCPIWAPINTTVYYKSFKSFMQRLETDAEEQQLHAALDSRLQALLEAPIRPLRGVAAGLSRRP